MKGLADQVDEGASVSYTSMDQRHQDDECAKTSPRMFNRLYMVVRRHREHPPPSSGLWYIAQSFLFQTESLYLPKDRVLISADFLSSGDGS